MTPLTPTQKAILEALAGGAKLYGRADDSDFRLIWGHKSDERVGKYDVMHLLWADFITPWLPWPEITPLGRHALSDSGGGR